MRRKSIILSDKNYEHENGCVTSYCSNPRFKEVRQSVNERKYSVGETDMTYRMINHWDQHNLLPESLRKNSGWRKFTLVELVWLKIIKHLREFGLPLNKIAQVKECILEWNEKNNTYDSFEYYIVESWKSTSDLYLMIANNGDAEIATLPEMKSVANMIGQHDVLLISLTTVIEEVGQKTQEKQDLFNLTDELKALLEEINSGGDKEIKLKIKAKKIAEIESTSKIAALLAGEIRKQMKDEKLYGEITIKFEEGVAQLIEKKKRKRFEK